MMNSQKRLGRRLFKAKVNRFLNLILAEPGLRISRAKINRLVDLMDRPDFDMLSPAVSRFVQLALAEPDLRISSGAVSRLVDQVLVENTTQPRAKEIILCFPPYLQRELRESVLKEGIWKKYDNNYDTRLDRRPPSQGGDQLHIRKRDGSQWAYRYTGSRSEGHKYTLAATTAVQGIVRGTFALSANIKIECRVRKADPQRCLVEIVVSGLSPNRTARNADR